MEIQSASRTEKAALGEGYNTKEEAFAGECVLGTTQYLGAQESNINFQRSMSATELADSLGFSIGGRARIGLISASMSAKFASESSSSDYSEIMIYSARYKFKNAKLSYTGLTPVGERAKGSSSDSNFVWDNWEKTCGHEYVEQITLGASLYISVKLEFSSKAEKTAFNAEFDVSGPMFEVGGTLEVASKKFGKRASITVQAYQLGGDVSKLSNALSAKSTMNVGQGQEAKNVSALLCCSMDNPAACLALFDGALQYAANEFPQQIKPEYKLEDPAGPAQLSYITRPWQELALYPPPPLIAEAVRVAREDISLQFEQNLKYRNRVRALKTGVLRLSPAQRNGIDVADQIISDNFMLINEAANVCYTQMDKCVAKVAEIKSKLKPIDETKLEVFPETFAQWYDIQDLPDTRKEIKHTVEVLVNQVKGQINNFEAVKDKAATIEHLLSQLSELDLSNQNIVDLAPLASLTGLTLLNLGGNQITDISPLASLKNLKTLSLDNNQIVNVETLSTLVNLVLLELQYNKITDVASLSPLVKLTKLDLRGNSQLKKVCPITRPGGDPCIFDKRYWRGRNPDGSINIIELK